MATRHPTCERPLSGEAGGGQPRIWVKCDWILTEGCGRVSASREDSAVAARHRLRVNYRFDVSWRSNFPFAVDLFHQPYVCLARLAARGADAPP
jgi:hypothetical protein|eukprot:5574698-Prymnesium_polylepis.2